MKLVSVVNTDPKDSVPWILKWGFLSESLEERTLLGCKILLSKENDGLEKSFGVARPNKANNKKLPDVR